MNKTERPIGRSNTQLHQALRTIDWIWDGVVADRAITLLSAPEKIGKTTLLSLLLDRCHAGGQLLGRNVHPGKTILCSEESDQLWVLRQPPLDFGPDLIFHDPIPSECPTRGRWNRYITDLCKLASDDEPFDLLVIDTAASFLPLAQRNPKILRWAISTLRFVAGFPAAVLVINQSRNFHRPLAAFADIVIEMEIPRGVGPTRRRNFKGVGRYPGTLQSMAAELNPEGTDYVLLPGSPPPQRLLLATVQELLAQSPTPLTHRELLTRWPGPAPREDSLWRTLDRGVQRGLLTKCGAGTKVDAFRWGVVTQAEDTLPPCR